MAIKTIALALLVAIPLIKPAAATRQPDKDYLVYVVCESADKIARVRFGPNGARVWKFAANYGIGYRLMNFTMPGGRPAELHLNLAKMWLVSGAADVITGRSIDLMGFSVTFKRQ